MSLAEGVPPFLPRTDPQFHEDRKRGARRGSIRRSAILVSALVHGAIVLALLARLPALFPVAPPPPQPFEMIMVQPPPSPPKAKPSPSSPSALPHELVSGPGNKTTAPPQAIAHDAEAVHKPTETTPPAPAAKPRPAPTRHPPISKHARRESAPRHEHQGVSLSRAPGATAQEGDPYLNRLRNLIEKHRTYPANAIGLGLKGIGTYQMTIAANGTLMGVKIERSSGASILDQAAIRMIEAAAPFPPLPSYFRYAPFAILTATIPIYPPGNG